MAQKKNTTENLPKIVLLTISNAEFKTQISNRINSGEELLSRQIQTEASFNTLKLDFNIWNDYNTELLKQNFNYPTNEYLSSYENAGFTFMGQMGEVRDNPVASKMNLIIFKVNALKSLLAKADLIKSESNQTIIPQTNNVKSKDEVFIVHGHDELAKTKTARFVEKLGLKPIILHEQASSGKTIIEKIEEYSNVGFGIVLYTPCDLGCKKDDEPHLAKRARQNVIFEHGYLIGRIGRSNVCALVKNDIEVPNDISGVVYVKMDDDDSWHLKVAKELRNSGYEIDMNLL